MTTPSSLGQPRVRRALLMDQPWPHLGAILDIKRGRRETTLLVEGMGLIRIPKERSRVGEFFWRLYLKPRNWLVAYGWWLFVGRRQGHRW